MTDDALTKRNQKMLAQLHPGIRAKVAAVLSDLRGHGWRPRIQQALRTQAEQMENVRKGVSRTKNSYHLYGLAADILDDDNPLGADRIKERRFCLMLASSAWAHGLGTGTLWGLSVADAAKVVAAISGKDWDATCGLGWDAGHVEVKGITLAQAKQGVRPPVPKSI